MNILSRVFRVYLWLCGPYRRIGTVCVAIAGTYFIQPEAVGARYVADQLPYARIELYVVPLLATGIYLWIQGEAAKPLFWFVIIPYLVHIGYIAQLGKLQLTGVLPSILYVILLGTTLYSRYRGQSFEKPLRGANGGL